MADWQVFLACRLPGLAYFLAGLLAIWLASCMCLMAVWASWLISWFCWIAGHDVWQPGWLGMLFGILASWACLLAQRLGLMAG
jgi:hypothetical protein